MKNTKVANPLLFIAKIEAACNTPERKKAMVTVAIERAELEGMNEVRVFAILPIVPRND